MFSEITNASRVTTVTIGMPVYNDERYLRQALDSLLAQTFDDFELIVSDNCSTDRTGEICQEYAAKDQRIRYYRQPSNLGPQANFNFLLRQANGEFFMWAASDDRWDEKFIHVLVDALRLDESYVSAFCPYICVDEYDQPIYAPRSHDYSGRSVLRRISKFCYYYDDGFFYGLHRRKLVQDAEVPVWWWINSQMARNNAYPVLVFFLSRGGYVQAGASPLWFNRRYPHDGSRHSQTHQGRRLVSYLAFLLRKLNVFYESVQSVFRGTRSFCVTLVVILVLAIRLLYDIVQETKSLAVRSVGFVVRKLKGWRQPSYP